MTVRSLAVTSTVVFPLSQVLCLTLSLSFSPMARLNGVQPPHCENRRPCCRGVLRAMQWGFYSPPLSSFFLSFSGSSLLLKGVSFQLFQREKSHAGDPVSFLERKTARLVWQAHGPERRLAAVFESLAGRFAVSFIDIIVVIR